jgi:ORF6N domain-containing protein
MSVKSNKPVIPDEVLINKIYLIRGQKVMIDRDLAELYGVETRVLNQAVKRNEKRFPKDFMFRMIGTELEDWISQTVISNREKMGLRKPPLVFTEQGVAMLSGVLNSVMPIGFKNSESPK